MKCKTRAKVFSCINCSYLSIVVLKFTIHACGYKNFSMIIHTTTFFAELYEISDFLVHESAIGKWLSLLQMPIVQDSPFKEYNENLLSQPENNLFTSLNFQFLLKSFSTERSGLSKGLAFNVFSSGFSVRPVMDIKVP